MASYFIDKLIWPQPATEYDENIYEKEDFAGEWT